MKTRLLIAAALVAAAPAAWADDTLAKLQNDITEAESALVMKRVTVPACGDANERAQFIDVLGKRAKAADVEGFSAKSVDGDVEVPVEGFPSPIKLQHFDFQGHGSYPDVQMALRRIANLSVLRMIDFDALHVRARAGGGVDFDGRISVACWMEGMPTHAKMPPSGTVQQREMAMMRDQLRELNALVAALTRIEERKPMMLVDSITAAAKQWSTRALLLTELRYDSGAVTLRGVTSGAAAKDGVAPALRSAGFDVRQLDWTSSGQCQGFTATAVPARATTEAHDYVDREIFDERTTMLCGGVAAVAPETITVRGTGKLAAHTKDISVSSAFRLLNAISPSDGYVVDPAVAGHLRLDVDHATIDEILAAVRAAGLFVGRGPLHRVCAKQCSEIADQKFVGTPISITVTDAQAVDLLRALEPSMDPLELYAPPDLQSVISVYATDVAWDRLVPTIIAAAGREYRVDAPRIYVGRAAELNDPKRLVRLEKVALPRTRRTFGDADPAKLAVADVRINAVASDGANWIVYAEAVGAPDVLVQLQPGTKLLDGVVESAGHGKVTIRGAKGIVTATLAGTAR